MKIVIFSDTHLTEHFDVKLFDYIAKLVKTADQVIINGDFWDSYLTSFDRFVNSSWSQLFPLLKPKTIYLYGNHDLVGSMDGRVKFFSQKQAERIELLVGRHKLMVEHGHKIAREFDDSHPHITRFISKHLPKAYPTLDSWYYRQDLLGKIWRGYTTMRTRPLQNQLRQFAYQNHKKNLIRVFGHSSLPAHNELERGFVCLGDCRFGKFRYLLVENGEIVLADRTL